MLVTNVMLRAADATRWPSIPPAPLRSTPRNRSTFHRRRRSAPIAERLTERAEDFVLDGKGYRTTKHDA
jgi:hypothetical protein